MIQHARRTPQTHDDADDSNHGLTAEDVGDRPYDNDRGKAGNRDEHVQDTEHSAPNVLRQLLLELRLGGNGDNRVARSDKEGDAHHK